MRAQDRNATVEQSFSDTGPAADWDGDGSPKFSSPSVAGEIGQLGPYRIIRQLGKGGMGAVYLAHDPRLNRQLAIKVMLPKFAANAAAKERFLREARAAAPIAHDNVVPVFEADERDGIPYIAMPLLQGTTLETYLEKKGRLSPAQIVRVGKETAAGLAAAHAAGLVHRDIKPANLWLEAPGGRVKILDFGLVKGADHQERMTQNGMVVGTPAYMSPEQASGGAMDARSDLFSLGAVLYELATGQIPFGGENVMAMLSALANRPPAPVRELNPDIPEPLAGMIHRLLEKNPAARPQTAAEVSAGFARLGRQLAAGDVSTERPVPVAAALPEAVFVPIPLTMPGVAAEPNVFAGLDTSAPTELDRPSAPAVRPAPPRRPAWMLAAAGFAAFGLVALGGVVVLIKNRDGTVTEIKVPDGATVQVKSDGKTVAQVGPPTKKEVAKATPKGPAGGEAGADRTAAEWVLAAGGRVQVDGGKDELKAAADLPGGAFRLTGAILAGVGGVTDESVAPLAACRGLATLHLWGTAVTDKGLARFKDSTTLTHFSISGDGVTDAGAAHLAKNAGLEHLNFYRTKVTDAGVALFKDCAALAEVTLAGPGITDEALQTARGWKALRSADLREAKVTAGGVAAFAKARPECRVEWDGGVVEPTAPAGDADRRGAEAARALGAYVEIDGTPLAADAPLPTGPFKLTGVGLADPNRPPDDAALAAFAGCAHINNLNLLGGKMTDAGLAHFKGCRPRSLFLSYTRVTDAGLAHLPVDPKMEVLGLRATKVTDAGLARYKDCAELGRLDLRLTGVTDAGLAAFRGCTKLRTVDLAETGVTDAGLAHLRACPGLTHLALKATKVTAAGVGAFAAAVPGCRVEWDGGVVEPKAAARPLTPEGAARRVGEVVTVEFRVAKVALRMDEFKLRAKDDDAVTTFSVSMSKPTARVVLGKTEASVLRHQDVQAHFEGKTIRATGTVRLNPVSGSALDLTNPKMIEVVPDSPK